MENIGGGGAAHGGADDDGTEEWAEGPRPAFALRDGAPPEAHGFPLALADYWAVEPHVNAPIRLHRTRRVLRGGRGGCAELQIVMPICGAVANIIANLKSVNHTLHATNNTAKLLWLELLVDGTRIYYAGLHPGASVDVEAINKNGKQRELLFCWPRRPMVDTQPT
ncbi:hypothetical protein T492DRAFT_872271 [Pavlovales sp. CCMP2436]|nr:hypothetical protein T492DRAFT_872271 [Pavlovales sp. CCMP2436]